MSDILDPVVGPHRDETVSSWLTRWLGQHQCQRSDLLAQLSQSRAELAIALIAEPDYPNAPGWARALAAVTGVDSNDLEQIAWPPSPWVLSTTARRSVCVACLGEDGSITNQYMRQTWTDSWRTMCQRHGLPLIYAPALGWGWGGVSTQTRNSHTALMRRPYTLVENMREAWRKLPCNLTEGVFDAELRLLEVWSEHCSRGGQNMGVSSGELRIWEDLLALCTCNWHPWTDEAPAALVLPTLLAGRSRFFRALRLPGFQGECGLEKFRSIEDPAVRRTALLCVADAMLDISSKPLRGKSNVRAGWGWRHVAANLPVSAWTWLDHRSKHWPPSWRRRVSDWMA